jgi:hypothetical protein
LQPLLCFTRGFKWYSVSDTSDGSGYGYADLYNSESLEADQVAPSKPHKLTREELVLESKREELLTWEEMMIESEREEQLNYPERATLKQEEDKENALATTTDSEEKLNDTVVDGASIPEIDDATVDHVCPKDLEKDSTSFPAKGVLQKVLSWFWRKNSSQ